jgi:hypothetical protein
MNPYEAPSDPKVLGKYLRKLIKTAGIKQKTVADLLKVDERTVRRWIAKKKSARRNPPWHAVELLRRRLGR